MKVTQGEVVIQLTVIHILMNPKGHKWISLNLNKIQAQKYIKFLKNTTSGKTFLLGRAKTGRYLYRSAFSMSPIAVYASKRPFLISWIRAGSKAKALACL